MVRMKTPHDSNATNVRAILACSLNVYIYTVYISDRSFSTNHISPTSSNSTMHLHPDKLVVYISLFLLVPLWWYSHAKFYNKFKFFRSTYTQFANNIK